MSDALLYTPSGCVLYLDLRKPVGDKLLDYSGHGNAGTIYEARLEYRHPLWGLFFDGKADYVYVGDKPSLKITGAITLEALINISSAEKNDMSILRKWMPGKWSYMTRVEVGKFQMLLASGGTIYTFGSGFELDAHRWYHVVGAYDGARRVTIYVDGVIVREYNFKRTIDDTDAPLVIGARSDGASGFFFGYIALARVYNRALTAKEVKRCYEDIKLRLLRRMQPVGVEMIR